MKLNEIKGMRETRGQKLADMKAILAAAEGEKRALNADENTRFEALSAEAEQLQATIDKAEKLRSLELAQPEHRIGREDTDTPEQLGDLEARQAFNHYCRTGELRASNTITTSTGAGAYVPKQVLPIQSVAKLANSLEAATAFYGIPDIPVTGKMTFSVPVIDMSDGSTVAGNAEGESLATTADASITLTVDLHNSGAQYMDNGIITAVAFDAVGSLVPVLEVACERGEEAAWFTASIMTAANKAAAIPTAASGTVTSADISALLFGLGGYAVGRCAYLVSMSMLAAMHSMADTTGRPVNKLTRDASGQFFWDGVPVFPTTQLEAVGGGKFSAAAINVDAARIASSQAWVNRYDQNPARPNQTGFDYLEYSAFGIKSGAVKLLEVKA